MASKLPPSTPRHKSHARTASLDSGGKVPSFPKGVNGDSTNKSTLERRSSRPEKRTLAGRGLEVQDEHSKMKEQLAMIERSKSSLMQDLARAKRNVEELTTKVNGVNGTCKKDKVHSVVMHSTGFQQNEGWQVELDAMKQQYELALLELQSSKQAIESLKHELMICVEAKDEAVRLAGEAMSAAESTARRVEELSAELFTTNGSALTGDGTTAEMDDLIDELSMAMETSLFEIEGPLETITQEETLLPTVEEIIERRATKSVNKEIAEVNAKNQRVKYVEDNDQETQRHVLTFSLEALQRELAAAKGAEQKATNQVLVMQADMEIVKLEAEKFRSADSTAQASLAKVSRELEEAEAKLAKASVEDAALGASLGSLKAELVKSQHEIMEALDRETTARSKATEVLDCMEKMKESNLVELLMWKEREASARATAETLQMDLERQKSESKSAAEKERIAAARISDMIKDLERSRTELIEQQKHSSCEIGALSAKLETNQAKLAIFEESASSSAAKITTLMFDIEKKQAEVNDLQCKLSEVESKAEAVGASLRQSNLKLADLEVKEQEASKTNQAKLAIFEESASSSAAKITTLMFDIGKKQAEVNDLQYKLSEVESQVEAVGASLRESNLKLAELEVKEQEASKRNQAKLAIFEESASSSAAKITTLMFDIEKKQAEVNDLQYKLSEVESKAEAVGAELSNLRESNLKLAELEVKEQEASAKVITLNTEVCGLKQALEEALNAGIAARDELCNLEVTLQNAISERDEATCKVHAAYHEIEFSKQMAAVSSTEAKTAKDDAERTLDAMRAASNAAVEEARLASQLAQEKAQLVREEADAAENKLQAALKEIEMASMEVEKFKQEAQSAREDADFQKAALAAEKERADAMENEAQEVRGELVHLRSGLTKLQAEVMDAVAARKGAECRLQDVMEQLEAHNLRGKEEGLINHMRQEEAAKLKEKLRLCEEQLKVVMSEAEALQSSKLELIRELEGAKEEKEASKRAVVDAHQHLADMEKAKRVMEADIQRLLDDSKLWKTPKDTRDIMALSEFHGINGYLLVADSRDEKPQPDSPDRESLQSLNATYLQINGEKREEELVFGKEEDEPSVGETPIRVGKKKKPALLHRLHSYLDKKKTTHAP